MMLKRMTWSPPILCQPRSPPSSQKQFSPQSRSHHPSQGHPLPHKGSKLESSPAKDSLVLCWLAPPANLFFPKLFSKHSLRARPQIVLDGFSASEDTFVFESHLRLLTVEQLAGVRVPDSHPPVLPGRVEEGVGEQSSMNPRHVPVNPMSRLHTGSPPVFKAWQAAFAVGEVDRPDDCGAVVAGGGDGLG